MASFTEAMGLIEARLKAVGSRSTGGNEYLCPVHEADGRSHSASLTVRRGDEPGQIIMHCAKCRTGEVLNKLDLTFADLAYNDSPRKKVGNPVHHDYADAEGRRHLRVTRQRYSEGRAKITQSRWTGKRWEPGLGNPAAERVLYQLPKVRKHARKGRVIHLTEGESDADALNQWFKQNDVKEFATCHPQGAGRWGLGNYAPSLAGAAKVVVWADRDAPGYACAASRFSALQDAGFAADLRLPIPDHDKADVRDHLDAGHTPKDGKCVSLADLSAPTSVVGVVDPATEKELQKLRAQDNARRLFRTEKIAARHALSRNARKMSGSEFFLDLPDETPTLWGDGKRILWIDGEPLLICGDDGTGKSTIDHQLIAARLGFRDKVLDYTVTPADGTVLYLAMDRPEQARRAGNRLFPEIAEVDFRSTLAANLVVWRGPLPVDVLAGPEVLADWIHAEFGPVAEVHADSLKDVASKLSDDAVGSGMNSAIQEVVSRGINWVGLHHQRKASGENRAPDSLSDVYGSRWLTAGQGSVLMLVKAGESDKDQVEMRQLKEPSDRVPALLLQHDRSRGRTRVVQAVLTLEQVLWAARSDGATAMEVAAAMFGKDKSDVTDAEKKKADRQLARLVKSEEVTKVPARKGGSGGTDAARFYLVDGGEPA